MILFTFLFACKKDKSVGGDEAQKVMGLYALGFNKSLDLEKELNDYFDDVPKTGPKKGGKYNVVGAMGVENDLKEIEVAFTQAQESSLDILSSLNPLATTVSGNLEALSTLYSKIRNYYEAEDYKDDDYAKGISMHKEMVALSNATTASIGSLGSAMSAIEDQQAVVKLQEFASEKGMKYWYRYFNMQAKKTLQLLQKGDVSGYEIVLSAHTELIKYLETQTFEEPGPKVFKVYADASTRFFNACKKLKRQILAKEKIETQPVVSAYNFLIDMSNTLSKLEGQGLL